MAGTRLTILSITTIQVLLLLRIAIHLSNRPYQLSTFHDGIIMFVNRLGLDVLHDESSSLFGGGDDDDGHPLSRILTKRLVELRRRVEDVRYPIRFRVGLVNMAFDDDGGGLCTAENKEEVCPPPPPVVVNEENLASSLRSGLLDGSTTSAIRDEYDITVTSQPSSSSHRHVGSQSCDEIASHFPTSSTTGGETGYQITIILGCTTTTTSSSLPSSTHDFRLNVDDSGNILLLVRRGAVEENVLDVVREDVARFILEEYLVGDDHDGRREGKGRRKSTWMESTSGLEVVLTLMEEDPFSYSFSDNHDTTDTVSPEQQQQQQQHQRRRDHYHHHRNKLYQTLSKATSTHLRPILDQTLSSLLYTHRMETRSLPYRGGGGGGGGSQKQPPPRNDHDVPRRKRQSSLSSLSSRARYQNGEYILNVSGVEGLGTTLAPILTNPPRNPPPTATITRRGEEENDSNNNNHANTKTTTLHWVLYVPPRNRLPFRIVSGKNTTSKEGGGGGGGGGEYGTAFVIHDRQIAVSVLNLPLYPKYHHHSANNVTDDDDDDDDGYEKTILKALSYFPTHLRQILNLSPLQPHKQQQPHNNSPLTYVRKGGGKQEMLVQHVPLSEEDSDLGTAVGYTGGGGGGVVSGWEMDGLKRRHWRGKALGVLDDLEVVLGLVEWKRDVAFSEESAQNVNTCLQHLHQALHSLSSSSPTTNTTTTTHHNSSLPPQHHHHQPLSDPIHKSTHHLNVAHHLSSILSTDPGMVSLHHFGDDEINAVFAPMMMPVLLPFCVSMFGEAWRYWKLVRKRR